MGLIKVRRATADDVHAIVEIEAGEEGPWGEPDSCRNWTVHRLARGFYIQIAFFNDEPAGHAEWIVSDEPCGKTFYLGTLQVKKNLQHRGVGRAMLADGEAEARHLACTRLSTMPEKETGSHIFYAKCGYQNARFLAALIAKARDMKIPLREIPGIPESVVCEKRFVAGLLQLSSRHMYEVAFHSPPGSLRETRCAEVPGGYVALTQFPDDARAQALAWGDFSTLEALRACVTFAAKIGVSGIKYVFDASEKEAVRAPGLGSLTDYEYDEMTKPLV